jgi:hypothetical protein
VLLALYHPRNRYILHLDAEAPDSDRKDLAAWLADHPVINSAANVRVVERANLITYRGPTMVANTLHAAADFLWGDAGAGGSDWDWFINLSASDYPLATQDGTHFSIHHSPGKTKMILFTFIYRTKIILLQICYMPSPSFRGILTSSTTLVTLDGRSMCFEPLIIVHDARSCLPRAMPILLFLIVCRFQRAKPVIIDPGLYMKKKADVFWIPQRRSVPTAFKLFTGTDTTCNAIEWF